VAARIDAREGRLPAAGNELVKADQLSPLPLPNEFVNPVRNAAFTESREGELPLSGGGGSRE
jgi:hypothetical protein